MRHVGPDHREDRGGPDGPLLRVGAASVLSDLGRVGGQGFRVEVLGLGHFQLGSYGDRSLIEGLYTL